MVTQEMLEAAMVEAVKRGMFPKDAPQDQYITAWENMRAVLEAAQQCVQRIGCTCEQIDKNFVKVNPACLFHGKNANR